MTSDSLKWRRFAFVVAFVIYINYAGASPVDPDNPCYKCGMGPKNKISTYKQFVHLEPDVMVGISSACSTIEFLCSRFEGQEGLKKTKTDDVCESFSSFNGLAVDCEKDEKVENCTKAKTFMEKMGKREYCTSICNANYETKSLCEDLFQVRETVSSSAGGAEESETEEGEVENKASPVKNAQVKKSATVNESNLSADAEGGKEKIESNGTMKQIGAVNSTSKPDEKVKNDKFPPGETGKAVTQPEEESTMAVTESPQKEESGKGNEKDDEEASKAEVTNEKKGKETEVNGTDQGAPGEEEKGGEKDPPEKEMGSLKNQSEIANESNSSADVEGGKEKVKSDGEMKQIEEDDNKTEVVKSTSKPGEKLKNDESPPSEVTKPTFEAEKSASAVTESTQKEEKEKGNEEDDKKDSGADVSDDKKEKGNEVDGTERGAPGEEEKGGEEDPSEKEKGSQKHADLDSDDVQQSGPHLVNHMNQSMSDSEKSYGHVMSYFFALTVVCIICYLVFHNKQKLIALVLEGRQRPSGRRGARRSGSAQYRKLDNNLEEADGPNSSTTFSQAVY